MKVINFEDFFKEFRVVTVVPGQENRQELMKISFEIRDQVFRCETRFPGFLEENPTEILGDKYDEHSAHILLYHIPTQQWIGTCRLIRNIYPNFLPIESLTGEAFTHKELIHRLIPYQGTAEISRLAILKTKSMSLAITGLFNGMFVVSKQLNLSHLYLMTGKPLMRRVEALGIHFYPVTSEINYYGPKSGYMCCNQNILEDIREKNPGLWRIITYEEASREIFEQKAA